MRGDLTVLDAVVDVGQDPVFDVGAHLRAAMHQRYPRAMAPQVERRNRRRVLASYHQHIQTEVRMRLVIVVLHLTEILAGNVQIVRQVVVRCV